MNKWALAVLFLATGLMGPVFADDCSSSGSGSSSVAPGLSFESISGLDPTFRSNLERMIADASAATGLPITINSGYRSLQRQTELWEAALARYGDPEIADNWVARPGSSMHNYGLAVDLGVNGSAIQYGSAASDWLALHASEYGLTRPLSNEGWHVEPIGGRDGVTTGGGGATSISDVGEADCGLTDLPQDLPEIFLMPWEASNKPTVALPGSYSSNAQ